MVETLRRDKGIDRAEFEAAARTYLRELILNLERPRKLDMARSGPPGSLPDAVMELLQANRDRIVEHEDQLRLNTYDAEINGRVPILAEIAGYTELSVRHVHFAASLIARAVREQLSLENHQLETPTSLWRPSDQLFIEPADSPPAIFVPQSPVPPPSETAVRSGQLPGPTLAGAVEAFMRNKRSLGLGQSQIDEIQRLLNWMQDEWDGGRVLATVTKDDVRSFRDRLKELDATRRGQAGSFADRLTDVIKDRVKSTTYGKYWRTVQTFFQWCAGELDLPGNPADGLKLDKPKGETKKTPEPFTSDELKSLCESPLYTGYQSRKRLTAPGQCRTRDGHWWSGVFMLHTGLRAGEMAQLLPGDFYLDAPIPHVWVRREDALGNVVKTIKNESSRRPVPIHANLLRLGLRQFVSSQTKRFPKGPVFGFRHGVGDKKADGATRFWLNYLLKAELWKPGRATHVFRHTLVDRLRSVGVTNEDTGLIVGHKNPGQTAGYGSHTHLQRAADTLIRLDFNFDLVAALGGPYDPKWHRA